MNMLHLVQLAELPWQPHPTIPDVMIRVFENRASHPLCDVMMAHIGPGRGIPWHIHETASETVYVVQGTGHILCTPDKTQFDAAEKGAMSSGVALTVAPQIWHSVINTGTEPMILFAFHTPPTF